MKTIRFLIAVTLLIAAPVLLLAANSGGTRVRAIMIVASNETGKSDPKLAPYEANLRRILRFESYRSVAEDSAVVAHAGRASIALTRGHRIELTSDGTSIRATWFDGSRKVIALDLPPGKPSVLGGPAWGENGEVCAVIIVPE